MMVCVVQNILLSAAVAMKPSGFSQILLSDSLALFLPFQTTGMMVQLMPFLCALWLKPPIPSKE